MRSELDKTYDPSQSEDKIYKFWEDSGFFKPSGSGKPFSVVIPPPNVTGQLHMGHALDNTLQDIIIRAKRMQGYNTVWIPGTDHAGIATQIKVEEALRVERGISRHDIGRDAFVDLVWEWKAKYGARIIRQLRKLGSSCDWTRERFTMDEKLTEAVRRVFVSLYDKGLIYRGLRITNLCPKCNTALSDAEVEYKEIEGAFWYINYPVEGSEGEYVTVATTRPETMLGDTAVAVNPEDERYSHLVGKTLILPLTDRRIPVIADSYVDREFGTGCVKITPSHDPNDFEMGLRHGLRQITVINTEGKINENGGVYEGLDRYEARRRIIADLEALGLLVKIEKHMHNVAHCYRCGTVVEPIASRQWFVSMPRLAEPAIEAVKNDSVRYIPDRFSKIYLNWMEHIHDWCISRQLWWGHRIPAFYCDDCGEVTVSEQDITVCPKCGSHNVHQDEDVLDTWFSSALWPFTTLGWPDDTEDLRTFYPTSVLVTGYDIITFWVSKMIFMGIECMDKPPFPKVFIHGLVRDAQGRKMSKSLGNGIDPLEIVGKYGADALRFALATGNSPGNDMRFSDEKIESARNFNNKIWNAARFVLMNLSIEDCVLPDTSLLAAEDKWILSVFNRLAGEVNANLESYELGVALAKLYDFIRDIYCDWYIELAKPRLADRENPDNAVVQNVLCYVLRGSMQLLHPFLPFITEQIWQSLPHEGESVMISSYPTADEALDFPEEETAVNRLIDAVRAVRNRRAEMNVPPSRKAALHIVTDYTDTFCEQTSRFFMRLASASAVYYNDISQAGDAVQIITDSAVIYIPLAEMIDIEKERMRLSSERDKVNSEIARLSAKLSSEGFVSKAPAAVVEGERDKLERARRTLAGVEEALEKLKG